MASTVYGFEDQLSSICATLASLDYEVINSHLGTGWVDPNKSNLENCLNAVQDCDLFMGIIRPYYGSGNIGELNITFEEMKLAIKLEKPYWFLVHHHVDFTRQLKKYLYYLDADGKAIFDVKIKKSRIFDSRTLDIYEYVLKSGTPLVSRTGNWVQKFIDLPDANRYIVRQFGEKDKIEQLIREVQHGK